MIKIEKRNDCVGCPDGCRNCGRNKDYIALESLICDRCKKDCDELYTLGRGYAHICADCIINDYIEINEDNFEDFI